MPNNEVDIECPHCGGPIKVIIQREDVDSVRRLMPERPEDTEELRKQKEW